jgi:hypothetical protein
MRKILRKKSFRADICTAYIDEHVKFESHENIY